MARGKYTRRAITIVPILTGCPAVTVPVPVPFHPPGRLVFHFLAGDLSTLPGGDETADPMDFGYFDWNPLDQIEEPPHAATTLHRYISRHLYPAILE